MDNIQVSDRNRQVLERAVQLLWKYRPDHARVIQEMPIVEVEPSWTWGNYMGNTITIAFDTFNSTEGLAMTLFHEAEHVLQERQGTFLLPSQYSEVCAHHKETEFWKELYPEGKLGTTEEHESELNRKLFLMAKGKLDDRIRKNSFYFPSGFPNERN